MGPIPEVGEHSAVILSELGYATEDVERLKEQGTI
jgi:crotonobetainyl-CoA:carnitine CoA-transferase CaiB-like acyl-CoA transferase